MLEIADLHAYYGKSHILQGVDMQIGAGEVVSLLGRNGVGRSTTVKSIMGEVPPQGSIKFKGCDIAGLPSYRIAHLGLGYVPEHRDIFPGLTVRQTLLLGVKDTRRPGKWKHEGMLVMFPNLAARADTAAGVLSGGEKQMLTMCRTLMGDPELIMIDEPTEGLAPLIVQQVGDLIATIAKAGGAILLVEQKLSIAMRISHRVYVMGHGRIVFEGTPDQLRDNDAVRKVWLEVYSFDPTIPLLLMVSAVSNYEASQAAPFETLGCRQAAQDEERGGPNAVRTTRTPASRHQIVLGPLLARHLGAELVAERFDIQSVRRYLAGVGNVVPAAMTAQGGSWCCHH